MKEYFSQLSNPPSYECIKLNPNDCCCPAKRPTSRSSARCSLTRSLLTPRSASSRWLSYHHQQSTYYCPDAAHCMRWKNNNWEVLLITKKREDFFVFDYLDCGDGNGDNCDKVGLARKIISFFLLLAFGSLHIVNCRWGVIPTTCTEWFSTFPRSAIYKGPRSDFHLVWRFSFHWVFYSIVRI